MAYVANLLKLLAIFIAIVHSNGKTINNRASGVKNPLSVCRLHCPNGYEIDENGYEICKCIDHCKPGTCEKGQICVIEQLCEFEECGIKIKCVRECPLTLECHTYMKCAYGFALDCDGCSTCSCNDPCGGVICHKNHYCSVDVLNCIIPPCTTPICKPYCPANSVALYNSNAFPVRCTGDSMCPAGYSCQYLAEHRLSYCCSN